MDITESLKEIIKSSPTAPFLFVGSGFSRRYLGLEDWKGLLNRFGSKLPSGFIRYVSESNNDLALAAEKMTEAYSEYWWSQSNSEMIASQPQWYPHISSPLRHDICEYLQSFDMKEKKLQEELDVLTSTKTVIDGIITTNWDLLLENLFTEDNYKVYVGQSNLLFSNPQKIAEIYKIHGCCTDTKSLVLTKSDYDDFHKKNPYLAAKLLSIFLEHPVIFIGYSLHDDNIKSILCSISEMMSNDEHKQKLADNLIFLNRANGARDSISNTHFTFGESKSIPITQIKTDDFSKVYLALQGKERKIPAHILRIFREQFYEIVQGESPEKKLYCSTDIEEIIKSGNDIEFVAGFGVAQKGYSDIGLKAVDVKIILSDALYDDIPFDRISVLENSLDEVCKKSIYTPINRYINADPNFKPSKSSSKNFKELFTMEAKDFSKRVSNGYKKSYRIKELSKKDISSILEDSSYSESVKMDYLALYIVDSPKRQNLLILESYLKENFEDYWKTTNYKRLLCVYDRLI
ncbi:hypothetical protein B9T23_08955 [Acinetobacter terrae]|uniref:SIR2 family protein n=1 Tax=Acinetobacter terrae TaxID=2731247 RepID=UPI000A347EC7|nr:SIR2 family protein [Acinetobacter terrae]OTG76415.1 hypothetical protein B9T23_08955 [Acinetobacter terrae]